MKTSFPLRGAKRGFEEHCSEPLSAQSDAADWAGTVGMGVVSAVVTYCYALQETYLRASS